MNDKQKEGQRKYAEKMVSIRDTVLCMYENRNLLPLEGYNYRAMLECYLMDLDKITDEIRKG